jgi:glycosyltransferase involved in cell wall biosynthesis
VKPRAAAPLVIGYVGRLNPEKGLEQLIDAAAWLRRQPGLPPWQLVIIGPHSVAGGGGGDDYQRSLEARARAALPESHFEFTGPIYDAEKLARRYGEIDLFCYPTLAEQGEGLSVAPIEAMAAGAVPIVSDLECYRDLIVPGENGLLFDHRAPDAVAALGAQLAALLRDPERRARLAARAQADARRFDYAAITAQLLDDFLQLAARD